jgi:hypothetical protein
MKSAGDSGCVRRIGHCPDTGALHREVDSPG